MKSYIGAPYPNQNNVKIQINVALFWDEFFVPLLQTSWEKCQNKGVDKNVTLVDIR